MDPNICMAEWKRKKSQNNAEKVKQKRLVLQSTNIDKTYTLI